MGSRYILIHSKLTGDTIQRSEQLNWHRLRRSREIFLYAVAFILLFETQKFQ